MNMVLKIILTVLGVLYILSPYDLLPDFIPVLGQGDDLFILGALFYFVWRVYRPSFIQRWLGGFSPQNGPDPTEDQAQKASDHGKTLKNDPFEILGISREATPAEIKAAYRRESQRYHPDKVAHLGEEFQNLAKKKFIEIQKAYEALRQRGGW